MRILLSIFLLLGILHDTRGEKPTGTSNGRLPKDLIFVNRILKNHCVQCHGEKQQKADIRFDQINWDNLSADAANLQEALDQVILRDMPPPKESKLSKEDRLKFHSLLSDNLRRSLASNRQPTGFVPARLTKAQFIYSLEELLSVPIREDLASSLPGDKSGDASTDKNLFNNNRSTLTFTLLHYELYKSCIEDALDRAIPDEAPTMSPFWSHRFDFSVETDIPTKGRDRGKEVPRLIIKGQRIEDIQPPVGYVWNRSEPFDRLPTRPRFGVEDFVDTKFLYFGKTRVSPPLPLANDGYLLHPMYSPLEFDRIDVHFLGPNSTFVFHEIKKSEGLYRLRVHAGKGDDSKEHPKLSVYAGPVSYFLSPKMRKAGQSVLVDAPKGEHKVYEFFAQLNEDLERTVRDKVITWPLGFMLRNEVYIPDGQKVVSPALHIRRIQLDGPYYQSWPITRERKIFPKKIPAESEASYAERIISQFLTRAFRGDVQSELQKKYFAHWKSVKQDGLSFRQSIKHTLKSILLSPNFLYLDADPTRNRHQEVATRLAYFLWNSPPSAQLLSRSKRSNWKPANELGYMLNHPRFGRFMEAFAWQWLQLKEKPDEMLRGRVINRHILAEPAKFLEYVFQNNLSLENLIDSDFLVINDALAKWYEIPKEQGIGFARVDLPDDSPRGGVLTMAAPLTTQAKENGVSDPILRGVWMCERILGRHLPPPPMNVEFPNPDDFKDFEKLTIRDQLKFHQENEACYGCHRRIDPLGLPFENFDGYGRWRETNYVYKMINKKTARSIPLAKVDARSEIKGDKVGGIKEFKVLLKTKYKAEILKSFTNFMYAYAIGRSVRLEEREMIDNMTAKFKASGYKPEMLLRLIVESQAFSNPRGK
tara:strand:- start:2372 stop:4996 length:2625 start_codon:yes stop_codon:yes gene_type:complete